MTLGQPPVEIVAYDPEWPARFAAERDALQGVLAPWLARTLEHIGSTAVPGLSAKPIIDIMGGVGSLEASRPAIAAVAPLGYCYFPYLADQKHWFCKPSDAVRTHHLHLIPVGSPHWIRQIAFRDYLRDHPGTAQEYDDVKRRLARELRFDREAYTDAKGPFINAVIERALAAGYGSPTPDARRPTP